MSCLKPGRAIEASGLTLPVRLHEAALALEDIAPALINSAAETGDCPAILAIVDRFESCTFEHTLLESIPEAGGPIMPLQGADTTEAILDSWVAKGSVMGEDGSHTVFVAFMEVMRRPLQPSWTAQTITIMGTKQSVTSLIEELEFDSDAVPAVMHLW